MHIARFSMKVALFLTAFLFASCLVFAAWVGLSLLSVYALLDRHSPELAAACTSAIRILLWPGRLLNPSGGPGATCVLFSLGWGGVLVSLVWLGLWFRRRRKKATS